MTTTYLLTIKINIMLMLRNTLPVGKTIISGKRELPETLLLRKTHYDNQETKRSTKGKLESKVHFHRQMDRF